MRKPEFCLCKKKEKIKKRKKERNIGTEQLCTLCSYCAADRHLAPVFIVLFSSFLFTKLKSPATFCSHKNIFVEPGWKPKDRFSHDADRFFYSALRPFQDYFI